MSTWCAGFKLYNRSAGGSHNIDVVREIHGLLYLHLDVIVSNENNLSMDPLSPQLHAGQRIIATACAGAEYGSHHVLTRRSQYHHIILQCLTLETPDLTLPYDIDVTMIWLMQLTMS